MNISKFLLIDAALAISAIPLIFLLQGGKRKSPLLTSSNKKEPLGKSSIRLPDKEKLLGLEILAKYQGSGIEFYSLIGDWRFVSVWKKDIDEEDPIFSSLLRIFSAKIEFKKEISTENSTKFSVVTSIQFGLFTIEFSGSGCLKGKQPLLPFVFNLIELKSGSNILLSRSLKEPEEKEKSFFALIALEENGKWLSARGQGGAVVIWLRD
ncbi:hypothetical protein [Prochlorococcus marinus]|uniref:hypothetical protein n=1 Tax=Prochlorococcus marinus TaxID=1219 RepID=UPI0022B2EA0E|nr:hypothetical protein [Prochlorococcus marinus]